MNIDRSQRDVLISYIYDRVLSTRPAKFVIKEKIQSELISLSYYESMTYEEKITLYKKIVDRHIFDYLLNKLENESMFMFFVNGSPEKRRMRIAEYVNHQIRSMEVFEKKEFYKKLGFKYIDN
jgi:hypothetical protein